MTVLNDKVEKHRENSIKIVEKLFEYVKPIENDMASTILKEFIVRLNSIPYPEQSEEIRIMLLKLIRKILNSGYTQIFIWTISDISHMISKIL